MSLLYIADRGVVSNKDYPYLGKQSECIDKKFTPVTQGTTSVSVIASG